MESPPEIGLFTTLCVNQPGSEIKDKLLQQLLQNWCQSNSYGLYKIGSIGLILSLTLKIIIYFFENT